MRVTLIYYLPAHPAGAHASERDRHKRVRMCRDRHDANAFVIELFRSGDVRFHEVREVEAGGGQFTTLSGPF
jgi:hypothetical protein